MRRDGEPARGELLQGEDLDVVLLGAVAEFGEHRVGADDWEGLDAVLAELRDSTQQHDVEIFTLQQFTPGGLAVPAQPSPIARC